MQVKTYAGQEVHINDEGFLLNAAEWSPDVADGIAVETGVAPLTEEHWRVLSFCREDAAKKGESPGLRRIAKFSGVGMRDLYRLFPRARENLLLGSPGCRNQRAASEAERTQESHKGDHAMSATAELESQVKEASEVNKGPEPITKVSIICSKGTLDMAYPGLILANAARMSGIDATLFFTFWGLDIVTKKKMDHLHVATVGNPSMHIPTMLGGLPGMETVASHFMRKEIDRLDLPSVPSCWRFSTPRERRCMGARWRWTCSSSSARISPTRSKT